MFNRRLTGRQRRQLADSLGLPEDASAEALLGRAELMSKLIESAHVLGLLERATAQLEDPVERLRLQLVGGEPRWG